MKHNFRFYVSGFKSYEKKKNFKNYLDYIDKHGCNKHYLVYDSPYIIGRYK